MSDKQDCIEFLWTWLQIAAMSLGIFLFIMGLCFTIILCGKMFKQNDVWLAQKNIEVSALEAKLPPQKCAKTT